MLIVFIFSLLFKCFKKDFNGADFTDHQDVIEKSGADDYHGSQLC